MSESTSRFTPQNKTTHERLSTNTVGLVALSDFRKRRAEVLEQQEREARELATAAATPPDRSLTSTPNNAASDSNSKDEHARKKKKRPAKALVSFGGDEEEDDDGEGAGKQPALSIKSSKFKINSNKRKEGEQETPEGATAAAAADKAQSEEPTSADDSSKPKRITANPSALIVPRALTKSALRKEAEEKEALRKEFLTIQAAVKATEIAIPFVFYDGTNTPGGIVRVKKGDHVWLFLDKSRKVGAQLRVGSDKSFNYRRNWARVSVDDLILVRGSIIIPHVSLFYICSEVIQFEARRGGKILTLLLFALIALRILLLHHEPDRRARKQITIRL